MPDGWEKDAGSVGNISLINWPDVSAAENKKYRDELREREAKKVRLGFSLPLPPGDPESGNIL
jgi:hypothetical protein